MASVEECDKALRSLADLLARVPPEVKARYVVDRTVSCRVSDLGVTWSGRLCDEGLVDVTTEDNSRSQVRLTVGSEDLVAMIEGRQSVPSALATGKLRVQASPLDMLRLTSLL